MTHFKNSVEITVTKLDSKPTTTPTLDDYSAYQYLEITKDKLVDDDVSKAEAGAILSTHFQSC